MLKLNPAVEKCFSLNLENGMVYSWFFFGKEYRFTKTYLTYSEDEKVKNEDWIIRKVDGSRIESEVNKIREQAISESNLPPYFYQPAVCLKFTSDDTKVKTTYIWYPMAVYQKLKENQEELYADLITPMKDRGYNKLLVAVVNQVTEKLGRGNKIINQSAFNGLKQYWSSKLFEEKYVSYCESRIRNRAMKDIHDAIEYKMELNAELTLESYKNAMEQAKKLYEEALAYQQSKQQVAVK